MLRKLGFGSQDEQLQEIRTRRSQGREEDERSWDRKKITLALLVLICGLLALLYFKDSIFPQGKIDVKGISDEREVQIKSSIGAGQRVRESLEEIKENVNNLNVVDIATSSPQIQKVISDIKALESLPRNQAKDACERICSQL